MPTASVRSDIQDRKTTSPTGKIRVEDWQDFAESVVFATSEVADGGTAHFLDTNASYTSGKLLSLKNNSTEKAYVDYLGAFKAGDGTAGSPSLSFASATDMGLYYIGSTSMGISVGGTLRLTASTTALISTVPIVAPDGGNSQPGFVFSGQTTLGFYRSSTDTVILAKNAGNAFANFAAGLLTASDASGGADAFMASGISGQVSIRSSSPLQFSSTTTAGGSADTGIGRNAAGVLEINTGTLGTLRDLILRNIVGQTGYHEMVEVAEPSAPADTLVRIFAMDAGAGKTKLMARFPSGASQQIAVEP